MKNIILIGMPGCGKTTMGKTIAGMLGMEFVDTDFVFEEKMGCSTTEYFSLHSEVDFRREETSILKEVVERSGCVVSTGGGVVERAENKEIIQSGGVVVFIDRAPGDIISDVDIRNRPLLAQGKDRVFHLHEQRYEKYKDFCHIRIENNQSVDDITKRIINEVKKEYV